MTDSQQYPRSFLHLVKIVEVNIYQALKVFLSDIFIFVFTLHMIRAGHVPTFFLNRSVPF